MCGALRHIESATAMLYVCMYVCMYVCNIAVASPTVRSIRAAVVLSLPLGSSQKAFVACFFIVEIDFFNILIVGFVYCFSVLA